MKAYYRQLLQSKDDDLALSIYLGKQWFIWKAIIVLASLLMLFQEDQGVKVVGFVLLGYLFGAIGTAVRGYLAAKARWRVQRSVIDWKKVDEYLQY